MLHHICTIFCCGPRINVEMSDLSLVGMAVLRPSIAATVMDYVRSALVDVCKC